MQAVIETQTRETIAYGINFGMPYAMNCFQMREKLDALFGGDYLLEDTPAAVKRLLFKHLETCKECCRSFDVRVRFRTSRRDRIY